ncbi:MAG: energy transducer TonB [Bryobacteraceae bacterium]
MPNGEILVADENLKGVHGAPQDDPDVHLQHLLAPAEVPWYTTLVSNVRDLVNPPKLPPLEITSKPVPIEEISIYGGNGTSAGIGSLLIHVGVVALLLFLGSLKPVQKMMKETAILIAPDISQYIGKKMDKQSGGGGGGGARSPIEASKGKLPKPKPRQFTPPRVDEVQAKLPMPASIIAPDDIPNIDASNFGDPLSKLGIPSNGTGGLGGIGSGIGGGVGSGRGAGVGPGSGGGFGGGVYRIGGGVSAPSVLSKVEPEYSEEARKAKWQGTVVLQLVVDDQGRPQNLKVLRSLGLGLDQKAIEAVEKWRFKPGMKDGKAVPVMATIEVNFRLL